MLAPTSLAISLVVLSPPEPANACTQAPFIQLIAVAKANAAGPIVFLARCGEVGSAECQATVDSGLSVFLGRVAVPGGIRELKTLPDGARLLAFTPSAPLSAGMTYEVVFNSRAESPQGSFELAREGSLLPLADVVAQEQWFSEFTGPSYSCVTPLVWPGFCGSNGGTISWFLETRLSAALTAEVESSDGWLFHGAGDEPSVRSELVWTSELAVGTQLPDDDEHCLTLEAWNVLDDTRQTRTLCGRASPKADEERHQTIASPNLGSCEKAPVRSDTGLEVPELLATWCKDRRAFCAAPQANSQSTYVCPELDERCNDIPPAPTTVDAGLSDAGDSNSDQPAADADGGCQLGTSPARGDFVVFVLGVLGLLLAQRTGRRRRGAG